MKTHKTRRSLLWGVLLAAGAFALTNGTATVRADAERSLTAPASASLPVQPYFWTENNDAQVHAFMLQAAQCIFIGQRTASQAYGIGTASVTALATRALD